MKKKWKMTNLLFPALSVSYGGLDWGWIGLDRIGPNLNYLKGKILKINSQYSYFLYHINNFLLLFK
jgi:hypothetical protein